MDDTLQWASDFNCITDDFDTVAFDLVKVDDEEEKTFIVVVRYLITDSKEKKVNGGVTIETGISGSDYAEIASTLMTLVNSGFFFQHVNGNGFVYNSDGSLIEEIDWNKLIAMSLPDERSDAPATKQYLH